MLSNLGFRAKYKRFLNKRNTRSGRCLSLPLIPDTIKSVFFIMKFFGTKLYEFCASFFVFLFFVGFTLILTYLNVSFLWEPFVQEHMTHQDLTIAN